MCKFLKVPRSTFYYQHKPKVIDTIFENAVIEEFRKSRNNYGTRKLKVMLARKSKAHEAIHASRRRIGKAMAKYELVSNYTIKLNKKGNKEKVNNDTTANIVNREFNNRAPLEVVVGDLSYVRVASQWGYLCPLLDLHNRKIIGSAVGKRRDASLVQAAFYSIQSDLRKIKVFHTDRGSEFKNAVIEQILGTFKIDRSLSAKGTPADNAVAEAMFRVIKTEFAFEREFVSFDELELYWFDYVNWYNNVRIHGSLGYRTPAEFGG